MRKPQCPLTRETCWDNAECALWSEPEQRCSLIRSPLSNMATLGEEVPEIMFDQDESFVQRDVRVNPHHVAALIDLTDYIEEEGPMLPRDHYETLIILSTGDRIRVNAELETLLDGLE